MRSAFRVVSPDLGADDPLHYFKDRGLVRHLCDVYARHVGANPEDVPFIYGRYGNGLYGRDDPGEKMTGLPEIVNQPGNGIIMVAIGRRSIS